MAGYKANANYNDAEEQLATSTSTTYAARQMSVVAEQNAQFDNDNESSENVAEATADTESGQLHQLIEKTPGTTSTTNGATIALASSMTRNTHSFTSTSLLSSSHFSPVTRQVREKYNVFCLLSSYSFTRSEFVSWQRNRK